MTTYLTPIVAALLGAVLRRFLGMAEAERIARVGHVLAHRYATMIAMSVLAAVEVAIISGDLLSALLAAACTPAFFAIGNGRVL